jgi:HPt (histidine-containing phosphotransfer) domain-containing protein
MLDELARPQASNLGDDDRGPGQVHQHTMIDCGRDLDPAVLADLESLGSDPGFVEMLLAGYMKDNSALVVQLESALHGQRLQDCRDLLHAMKGSAVSVGALRMQEFCERSEQLTATSLFHDKGEQVIQECRHVFSALCTQLNIYCVQRKVTPATDSQHRPS